MYGATESDRGVCRARTYLPRELITLPATVRSVLVCSERPCAVPQPGSGSRFFPRLILPAIKQTKNHKTQKQKNNPVPPALVLADDSSLTLDQRYHQIERAPAELDLLTVREKLARRRSTLKTA